MKNEKFSIHLYVVFTGISQSVSANHCNFGPRKWNHEEIVWDWIDDKIDKRQPLLISAQLRSRVQVFGQIMRVNDMYGLITIAMLSTSQIIKWQDASMFIYLYFFVLTLVDWQLLLTITLYVLFANLISEMCCKIIVR